MFPMAKKTVCRRAYLRRKYFELKIQREAPDEDYIPV